MEFTQKRKHQLNQTFVFQCRGTKWTLSVIVYVMTGHVSYIPESVNNICEIDMGEIDLINCIFLHFLRSDF